jgi:hypothetical protein
MSGASFSILSLTIFNMGVICLQLLNQSGKRVPYVARWSAKSDFGMGARTASQAILAAESYMQMCSECTECIMKTQKNGQKCIRSFQSSISSIRKSHSVKQVKDKKGDFWQFCQKSIQPFQYPTLVVFSSRW